MKTTPSQKVTSTRKKSMRAILYTEFNPDDMIDQETLNSEYGGDWNKLIKFLYEEEGMGIFDEVKFLRVEDSL